MKHALFKNAKVFQLTAGFRIDEDLLARRPARDCGPLEAKADGFAQPCDHSTRVLVHDVGGINLICWQTQDKLLPGSVVAEHVAERAADYEDQNGHPPGRKMLRDIKETVIDELLPKAFVQTRRTYAAFVGPYLIVDTSSPARAEALIEALARTLDNAVPLSSLNTELSPQARMCDWMLGGTPYGLTVDDAAVLEECSEARAQVAYQRVNLDSSDVRDRLSAGFMPKKVAVTISEKVSLQVDENLHMTRIMPVGLLNAAVESKTADAESSAEEFDATVLLIVSEVEAAIDFMIADMGGLAKPRADLVTEGDEPEPADDELYQDAVNVVVRNGKASTSLVQRHLRIGYNRAARLIELMEERGVVSAMDARGNRRVIQK